MIREPICKGYHSVFSWYSHILWSQKQPGLALPCEIRPSSSFTQKGQTPAVKWASRQCLPSSPRFTPADQDLSGITWASIEDIGRRVRSDTFSNMKTNNSRTDRMPLQNMRRSGRCRPQQLRTALGDPIRSSAPPWQNRGRKDAGPQRGGPGIPWCFPRRRRRRCC